ncbi:hypothetical protein [Pseudomonas monachiensis]|uniref:Uncharacterized protein n=1 Tax=Pseudomonas monachiensis TaxID=3060212 RepID=A0ABW9H8M2_9PSED
MNTPLLERHLAVLQMKHYLATIAIGDHDEYRRATIQLEQLVNEYGVQALRQAQEELL